MNQKILIKNGTIITLGENNKVLPGYNLLIEDGLIKKISADSLINENPDKIIDAEGKLVMPGFINAHMHFYSTLVRGLGKAKPSKNFQEVLENLWWRLDKKLSLSDTYYSSLVMLIQAIKCGTTTLIDHHASPGAVIGSLNEIARAVEETGLRASLCYELSDRDGKEISKQGIKENEEFIKYCSELNAENIKALFGLHASFTLENDTLVEVSEIAKKYDTGFHVHVAEAESDQILTKNKFGLSVVKRFNKYNILGDKTIAAHCVHLDDEEIEILKNTDTIVVHNPQSNMNNAVGIADIIKMQQAGILVGLGTDAMTVNMLEEIRAAMWAQHLKHNDPSCGFLEVVNTLFLNNSKIANRYWERKIGVLEEGAAADIILLDYFSPTPLNDETILGHFIFGLNNSRVCTTIVNGNVLMEDYKLIIDIDEKEINAKARENSLALWNRF